jgi:acetaldehyde dehydrogenase (acetylating)
MRTFKGCPQLVFDSGYAEVHLKWRIMMRSESEIRLASITDSIIGPYGSQDYLSAIFDLSCKWYISMH